MFNNSYPYDPSWNQNQRMPPYDPTSLPLFNPTYYPYWPEYMWGWDPLQQPIPSVSPNFSTQAQWDPPQQPIPSAAPDVSNSATETSASAGVRIDWKETPEAHVFTADVPGLKKEEVKVEVEDERVLRISGGRKKDKEEKKKGAGLTWHQIERSSGKFIRRFRLPENAKLDQIKAKIENGLLTVTVPKGQFQSIEISG